MADVLATVAQLSAATLLARGWNPKAGTYRLGRDKPCAFTGPIDTAEGLLARPLTAPEATALEACIRAHLEAGAGQDDEALLATEIRLDDCRDGGASLTQEEREAWERHHPGQVVDCWGVTNTKAHP